MRMFARAAFAVTLFGTCVAGSISGANSADVVRMGYSANFNTGLPLYTSVIKPEVFEKHGIKLELVDMRASAANCIAAMLANSIDACSVGTTAGTAAVAEGAPLKAIAMLQGPLIEMFLSKAAVAKTGVPESASPVDKIRGLKGRDVVSAPPGAAYNVMLNELLHSAGLSMSDIRFRPLVDQVAMKEGLRNGTFESVLWGAGAFSDLEQSGDAVRWLSIPRGDFPQYSTLPLVTIFAQDKWIDGNPDVVNRLHAALVDAIDEVMKDDGTLAAAIKAKYYPDLPRVNWDDAIKSAKAVLRPNADVVEKDWNFMMKLQEASAPGKDYSRVTWQSVVLPVSRAK